MSIRKFKEGQTVTLPDGTSGKIKHVNPIDSKVDYYYYVLVHGVTYRYFRENELS